MFTSATSHTSNIYGDCNAHNVTKYIRNMSAKPTDMDGIPQWFYVYEGLLTLPLGKMLG